MHLPRNFVLTSKQELWQKILKRFKFLDFGLKVVK